MPQREGRNEEVYSHEGTTEKHSFDKLARAFATNDFSGVSLGRSRFLRLVGSAMVGGLSATLLGPREATAAKPKPTPTTTPYCGDQGLCTGCKGSSAPGTSHAPGNCGANTKGGNCWFSYLTRSDGCQDVWKCCDYIEADGSHCYCSGYVTTRC